MQDLPAPYLDQLEAPDPFDRLAALEALRDAPEAEAAAVLTAAAPRLLRDEDAGVREDAARLLVACARTSVAEQIVPLIASTDITVRNLAGEVLVQMGPPAIPPLCRVLDDPDKDVRKFAIDLLALMPAQPVADRLAPYLADADLNVVLSTVDALGSLGATAYAAELRQLYAREPLARPNVVAAFGAFGGSDHLAVAAEALTDENPVVQLAAAEALAQHTSADVLDLLLGKVGEVHATARPIVLHSIVRLLEALPAPPADLPALLEDCFVEMLDDFDPAYRRAAVRGLRPFLRPAHVRRLLAHMGRDDSVDVAIFNTLASYPGLLAQLLAAVEDGAMTAETAAGFVLLLLMRQLLTDAEIEAAATFLATCLPDLTVDVRLAAVNVCQRLGHPAGHAVIRAGLQDPTPDVRTLALEAAQELGLDDRPARPSYPRAIPY